jgi:hypothetical protein
MKITVVQLGAPIDRAFRYQAAPQPEIDSRGFETTRMVRGVSQQNSQRIGATRIQ